jgi:hypothetical protein
MKFQQQKYKCIKYILIMNYISAQKDDTCYGERQ